MYALLLVVFLVSAGIVLSIVAFMLRLAVEWVGQREIPFSLAFKVVLIAGIGNAVLTWPIAWFCPHPEAFLLTVPIGFCFPSYVVGSTLKLSFGRACLVWLTTIAMLAALVVLLFGLRLIFTPTIR